MNANTTDRARSAPNSINDAVSLLSSGRPREALAIVTELLERAPDNLPALNIAGICSHSLGRLSDAEQYWRRALEKNPDDADINNNLGILLKEMKRFAEAEAAYRRALAIRPNHADAHANLGNLLYELKRYAEAEAAYRRTLEIRPDHAKTHNNLGIVLYNAGRYAEAEAAYRRAVEIEPNYAEAHTNLGNALTAMKRFSEAEAAYRRSLEIRPNHARTHNNLGIVLQEAKRFSEAETSYRKAITIEPANHEAHYNLGFVLYETKRFAEAETAYRAALSLEPDDAKSRLNLGLLLLHMGRFSEGWPLYETRVEKNSAAKRRTLDCPQWQGESLKGKSIVVHCEQGFGDAIQFVRYLPLLKAKGARHITLICPDALQALFEGIDGADSVLTDTTGLPAHDYWTFLLSLPLHLATTVDTIPATIPYLQPPADRLDAWKPRLPARGLRVGLVWKGSATHGNDRNRSLPGLAALAPLWKIANVNFISLQKGQGEEEASAPPPDQPLVHLGTDITDFADSAAIVAQLDLVICVDTAIAHLTGALGKPCWVLLPHIGADWRWFEDRSDSPWYPQTMRLFRQRDHDDWAPAILEVANALNQFAKDAARQQANEIRTGN